jgi:hypothetical protein
MKNTCLISLIKDWEAHCASVLRTSDDDFFNFYRRFGALHLKPG